MANVKKGQPVDSPEWWKHLRWAKRRFWKAQRQADKREARALNACFPPSPLAGEGVA